MEGEEGKGSEKRRKRETQRGGFRARGGQHLAPVQKHKQAPPLHQQPDPVPDPVPARRLAPGRGRARAGG
jgi:hypothetical protein